MTDSRPSTPSTGSANPAAIPDRLFFRIGEVARIVGVKPHVLRYWETEFREVRPRKSRSAQRIYSRKDVETLLRIRELLHDQRFTIEGARRALRAAGAARSERPAAARSLSGQGRTGAQDSPRDADVTRLAAQVEALTFENEELRRRNAALLAALREAAARAASLVALTREDPRP